MGKCFKEVAEIFRRDPYDSGNTRNGFDRNPAARGEFRFNKNASQCGPQFGTERNNAVIRLFPKLKCGARAWIRTRRIVAE